MTLELQLALTAIIEGYQTARRDEDLAARSRYPRAAPDAPRKAALRVRRTAARLVAALESAPPIARDRFLALTRARVNASIFGDWKPGDLLDDELRELAVVTDEIARGTVERENPGPRADVMRLAFAVAIARALERHGVHTSGHLTGDYARTLREAWQRASGQRLPDDARPLLLAALKVTAQDSASRR